MDGKKQKERSMSDEMAELQLKTEEMEQRIARLEDRAGAMSMYMPRQMVAMSKREVEDMLKSNPAAEFEVLDDYNRGGMRMAKGKVFCAQHYARIPDHVSSGLKIMVAR